MGLALPSKLLRSPRTLVRGMRFNGSTSYGYVPNAALPNCFYSSEYTMSCVYRYIAAGENNAGYIMLLGTAGGDQCFRAFINDGNPNPLSVGRDSSGADVYPFQKGATTLDTGVHSFQALAPNSLLGPDISIYKDGVKLSTSSGYYGDGLTSLITSTTGNLWFGDSSNASRSLNGEIISLALWPRLLSGGELENARCLGPLTVKNRLLFCLIGLRDVGPYKLPIVWNSVSAGGTYSVPLVGYS